MSEFTILSTFELSPARSIVISQRSNGDFWLNERVVSDEFMGFTYKGFGFPGSRLEEFIETAREVARDKTATEQRISIGDSKELVIWHPTSNTTDFRQWVESPTYTGYTRKGIRVVNTNALLLVQEIERVTDEPTVSEESAHQKPTEQTYKRWAVYDDACKSCGTTKRPHHRNGYCEVCYERTHTSQDIHHKTSYTSDRNAEVHQVALGDMFVPKESVNRDALERAFALHGKRCYVCQRPYNSLHDNMEVYYADGNHENISENNIYPICRACKATMS